MSYSLTETNTVNHTPISVVTQAHENKLSEQELGRFKQNEMMMSFEKIPNNIRKPIIDKYNTNEKEMNLVSC